MFNQQYWSAQYFDPVWFAPGDESEIPEEDLQPAYRGGGGRLTTRFTRHAVEYDRFKRQLELDKVIEAEDEEIVTVLTLMVGEIA